MPHYALPQWYHAYTDALGQPAGDYLGSLSQMDDSLGGLRRLLQSHGIEDNTMVWFATDNGPHTVADPASLNPESSARSGGQLAATNGLRQCKASVFEGGIRVPGFIAWPRKLGTASKRTSHVASSLDFFATVSEILGVPHPRPEWRLDSKSLLPLLDGRQSLDSARDKPIGWNYWGTRSVNGTRQRFEQRALTNQTATGTWKLVEKPAIGQCAVMLPPYKQGEGVFLFNLDSDATESHDLCASNPTQCDAMKQLMAEYMDGVTASAKQESMCCEGACIPCPSGKGCSEKLPALKNDDAVSITTRLRAALLVYYVGSASGNDNGLALRPIMVRFARA